MGQNLERRVKLCGPEETESTRAAQLTHVTCQAYWFVQASVREFLERRLRNTVDPDFEWPVLMS